VKTIVRTGMCCQIEKSAVLRFSSGWKSFLGAHTLIKVNQWCFVELAFNKLVALQINQPHLQLSWGMFSLY